MPESERKFAPLTGSSVRSSVRPIVCTILYPVTLPCQVIRLLIRKLNDAGQSFNALQHSTGTDYFAKVFAHPLTRYVPLQKNIEFHKICAGSIFFLSWLHMGFHLIDLIYANATTLRLFRMWGWNVRTVKIVYVCMYEFKITGRYINLCNEYT